MENLQAKNTKQELIAYLTLVLGMEKEQEAVIAAKLMANFNHEFKWVSEELWKVKYRMTYYTRLKEALGEETPEWAVSHVTTDVRRFANVLLNGRLVGRSTNDLANQEQVWENEVLQELIRNFSGIMKRCGSPITITL